MSAEAQGGYAWHGPSPLSSRALSPVLTTPDNLIDLGWLAVYLTAYPLGGSFLSRWPELGK
jgi:hypothetical protein